MMTQPKWWQSGAIYQIYPRSFQDSNDDGIGDIPGILRRLDYLDELGIGAIWLSPFFTSPMADFGYDVADYTDVDPMFGMLADFDQLVAEAHARGIKVIIDYVPNHSSNQHPWFLESRRDRSNPKHDWYIWRDAKPDGSLPNNWGSAFGGPAWTWDEQRGQYYFHQFAPEQPDLNWRNPDVKAAMLDVLRFWLDHRVDGFRMDVVYMIWKHPDMPDQPLQEGAVARGESDLHAVQQHLYDWDYEGVHEIMREFRVLADTYGDTLLVGEIWLPPQRWAAYFGQPDALEFQLPFNFGLMLPTLPWTAAALREQIAAMEALVPAHGYPNYVLNSHDQPRFASRIGVHYTRMAAMLLLTLRGTPTLYNGEEIGMENGLIEPHQLRDPQGINLGAAHTRDVTRTPFQWDDSDYAGFSTVETWLPVNPNYVTLNATAQIADPNSLYHLYRQLMKLRREHEALSIGRLDFVELGADVLAYTRTLADVQFMVIFNMSRQPRNVVLPIRGQKVLSTHPYIAGETVPHDLELWGYEGTVVRVD